MAKVNQVAEYNAIEWRNLPCDVTRNAFLDAMRESGKPLSVSTLSKTLSYLEQDKHAEDPSIYQDICQPRDSSADAKSTYPRLIPWEVYSFLEAIVQARSHHEKAYGNDLAQRVLGELSRSLDASDATAIANDYRLWHILNNDGVQQVSLSSFTNALKSRLSYIENEVCSPSHKINAEKLLLALEQLDILIYLLQQQPQNASPKYDSSVSALLGLYADLLSVRNSLKIDAAIEKRNQTAFNWHRTDHTNSLINAMIRKLNETSRSPTPEQVSSFLSLYQAYLAEETDAQFKENAHSFSQTLHQLKVYVNTTIAAPDVEQRIRHDLCTFANNVFFDLNNLDTIGYSYSTFEPPTANSKFMRSILADCHRDILVKIHHPLRILRAVYTLYYFTQGKPIYSYNLCQKMTEAKRNLSKVQDNLVSCYPQLLSINLKNSSSKQNFAKRYCQTVESIIDAPLSYEAVVDKLKDIDGASKNDSGFDIYSCLIGNAQVLKLQCEMVVAIEIKEAIPKLVQAYLDMPKYPPV